MKINGFLLKIKGFPMEIKGFRSHSMLKDSIPSEQAVTKLLYKAMWSYLCSCPDVTYGAVAYAVVAVFVVVAYAAGRYYKWSTTQELMEKYKKLECDYEAQEILLKTQAAETADVCFIHHNLIEKIWHTQPKTRKRKEEEFREADSKFHTNPTCPGLNAIKESEELVYRKLCQHCSKRLEKGKQS